MNPSKIEWLRDPITGKAGYSINPVKGLCPVGCSYCYARRMYKRFKWNPEIRYEETLMTYEHHPQFPNGSKVFVGSTMELFGDWIDPKWMRDIFFDCWSRYPKVTFIFLTKRPENLIKWSPFPDNCWVGVSATNEMMAAKGSAWLGKITATVKFLSLEPLLSWDKENAFNSILRWHPENVNWLIIGQQTPTSAKTTPKMSWIQEILVAASNAGNIPVFMKDNLKPLLVGEWAGWKLRQEFPR